MKAIGEEGNLKQVQFLFYAVISFNYLKLYKKLMVRAAGVESAITC